MKILSSLVLFMTQYYDDCIKSVNEVAQLDEENNMYKAPAATLV